MCCGQDLSRDGTARSIYFFLFLCYFFDLVDVAVREYIADEFNFVLGNLYSIDNKWDRSARIFFAQGCESFDEDISR